MEMNPKDMDAFERVVLAGMKLMFDEKTFEIFKQGMTKEDVPLPQRLAMETAGLMKMLMEKSGNTIPVQIIAPAAAMLLMEMGKFMTEAGVAKPTQDDIRQGTMLVVKILGSMYAKKPQGQPAQGQPTPQPAAVQPQQQPATGLIGA